MSEKCKDRIAGQLAGRLEMMAPFDGCDCWEADNYDCTCEEDHNADMMNDESILSIDEVRVYEIVLSTGGPSDSFVINVNQYNDIQDIFYKFIDWFDGAKLRLIGDEYDQALAWLQLNVYLESVNDLS